LGIGYYVIIGIVSLSPYDIQVYGFDMVLKVEDLEIYQLAEQLSDEIWTLCSNWNYFSKDTIGKQLVRACDSISANLAEGHGRYHFKDRLKFCYYARGSLEETRTWLLKASRRKLIGTEETKIAQIMEVLPKKLNAYINSIKKAHTESC
jgi:four helix bundle protein